VAVSGSAYCSLFVDVVKFGKAHEVVLKFI